MKSIWIQYLQPRYRINIDPFGIKHHIVFIVVAELIDAEGNQNIVKHPAMLSKQ